MNDLIHPVALALTQASEAAPSATEAAASVGAGGRSLLQFVHSGGPLSYLLVLLSIAALALIVANMILLRRERLLPEHVREGLEKLLNQRQIEQAIRFCQVEENGSFLASIVGGGLSKAAKSHFGMLDLKSALEDTGAREVERLERINHWIGILAAVGPMLGLLGTVFGMIGAFATIGSLSGVQRSQELSTYMSLALVCTAEGLVVAIPCTIAFAIFRRKIDALTADAGDMAERLVAPVLGQAAAPAPPLPGAQAYPTAFRPSTTAQPAGPRPGVQAPPSPARAPGGPAGGAGDGRGGAGA
ncbi:MAG: MotA/TolQ/ExbB proton channel family protein [Phycisphaerales bacterium]